MKSMQEILNMHEEYEIRLLEEHFVRPVIVKLATELNWAGKEELTKLNARELRKFCEEATRDAVFLILKLQGKLRLKESRIEEQNRLLFKFLKKLEAKFQNETNGN